MAFEDSNTPDGDSVTPGTDGTHGAGNGANTGTNTGANTPERRGITVRRAPRFVPFMVLGGVIGIIIAAFVAYGLPGDPSFDAGAVFGFFLTTFAAGGVLLGALAALILDRLSVRRAERAVVESVPNSTPDDSES